MDFNRDLKDALFQDTFPPGDVPFNFETRAPWYFYNHSKEVLPGVPAGAQYLPIIEGYLAR